MGKQFDELSKALASGISRREALRRFAGGILGGALAATVPGMASAKPDKANRPCVRLCQQLYPPGPERGACISASARCPDGQCAPFGLNQGEAICVPLENPCATRCAELAQIGYSYDACLAFAETCQPGTCPADGEGGLLCI